MYANCKNKNPQGSSAETNEMGLDLPLVQIVDEIEGGALL